MKKNWTSFGYFSPGERRSLLLLLGLAVGLFSFPGQWLPQAPKPALAAEDMDWVQQHLQEKEAARPAYRAVRAAYTPKQAKRLVLQPFDPNQTNAAQLEQMGIPARIAQNWSKYLAKGGKFRDAEGVKRLYGMDEELFQALVPWMRFEEQRAGAFLRKDSRSDDAPFTPRERQARERCMPMDVNAADSSAWQALPGIGAVLSARIIRFRDRLGGFYSLEQIKETYGLPDSTYQRILPCLELKTPPQRIDLNTADEALLRGHPYIGAKLARVLVAYRQQHGGFQGVDEAFGLPVLEPGQAERLRPYLTAKP